MEKIEMNVNVIVPEVKFAIDEGIGEGEGEDSGTEIAETINKLDGVA